MGGNALSNWTLINNDGNTPAVGVANFTNAWILIEDTIGISDSAAASTFGTHQRALQMTI